LGPNTTSYADNALPGAGTFYYRLAATNSGNGSTTSFSAAQTSAAALPAPIMVNGGFETGNFTGWTTGTGSTVSSTSPLAGNHSALQTPSAAQQLSQSFTPLTVAATTSFIFTASDPGGAGDRSMNVTFRDSAYTAGGNQINLRLVDLNADGDGDVQVFNGAWQTVLTDAVTFGSITTFSLTITPNGADYDFTWNSKAGKTYDLVSSTDLSTSPTTWVLWDGRTGITGTPPGNTITNIPGGGPRRFFAVIEKE